MGGNGDKCNWTAIKKSTIRQMRKINSIEENKHQQNKTRVTDPKDKKL